MRFSPRIVSVSRHLDPRNMHVPRPREVREKFEGPNGLVLGAWVLSSLLAVIIPVSKWAKERNDYYRYFGKYNEYEWKQKQYEEQANGNYNYNGAYGSLCSWWDFKCRQRLNRYQYYQQQNNNEDGNGMMMPSWYSFFGGKIEGDDREREEGGMQQSNGSMKFVYAWTIIMFIGLFVYGWRNLSQGKDRMGLIVALLLFGQFSLMNLITSCQGAIETDARYFENSVYGWFGQYSVLLAYTDFWMVLHSFIFAAVLGIMRECKKQEEKEAEDQEAMEYQQNIEDDPVLSERSDEYRSYA